MKELSDQDKKALEFLEEAAARATGTLLGFGVVLRESELAAECLRAVNSIKGLA